MKKDVKDEILKHTSLDVISKIRDCQMKLISRSQSHNIKKKIQSSSTNIHTANMS
jgi:hypothetical protein